MNMYIVLWLVSIITVRSSRLSWEDGQLITLVDEGSFILVVGRSLTAQYILEYVKYEKQAEQQAWIHHPLSF